MATIDYKQKIKDYMNSSEVDTLYKSMLNNLFPELKESEGERIRKHLIGVVELYYGNTDEQEKKDCLAWLEKQGGQKPVDNMEQYISKAAVLAEIERLANTYEKALDYEAALEDVRNFIDTAKEDYRFLSEIEELIKALQKEPVSEDLEQAIDTYLATYWSGEKEKQDWCFLKKMAIYFANWQKERLEMNRVAAFIEKVINFLNYKLGNVVATRVAGTTRPHRVAKQELIEDLKKYLED